MSELSVAMVTPWHVRCGIATYSEALAEALAQLGVDVYIIRLPRFGKKNQGILQNVVEKIPVNNLDLVHVQHEYGLYQQLEGGFYGALSRLGLPVVSTCHAVGNWSIDRVISEASDRVVVHNEYCAERFDHPSVIIPHGCTPAEAMPMEEAKRSYGFKPEWPIISYVGFISEYKGLETLIEAMEGLPDAGLLIGGGWHVESETGYITRLKQDSFERLPGRVQWLGYVPDRDLPRVYGAGNIVCYPSRFATESGALLTALSYGKAVVASSLKPFLEKEELGALTCFEDVEDLRMKIGMLLGNDEAREGLEEGARRYAEENRWGRVAELHRTLYEDVLQKYGRKSSQVG